MKNYHAHIYFDVNQQDEASQLQRKISAHFLNKKIAVSRLVNRPIGPHPKPMFEVDFFVTEHAEVVEFITKNIGTLSCLVHENTGDDVRDHSEGIQWIGPTLTLDFSFFEEILRHPNLRIHK